MVKQRTTTKAAQPQRAQQPPRRRAAPKGRGGHRKRRDVDAPAWVTAWAQRDGVIAAAVAIVAVGLFATTFSSHATFGDSAETVTGVKTLGILHAPGYPSYVVAAHVFGILAPVSGWAARVNAFSVICAAAAVGLIFLLGRRLGASRVGAIVGAFAIATAASVWFDATFAKHYPFSMLLVATALVLISSWIERGGDYRLVLFGLVLGLGLGSAWQQIAIVAVASIVLLAWKGHRPMPWRYVAGGVAAFVGVFAATCAFVVIRARQSPVVNWGRATTLSRLTELFSQQDFKSSVNGSPTTHDLPGRFGAGAEMFARDVGLAVVAVALVGAYFAWRERRQRALAFLATLFVLNAIAVVLVSGSLDSLEGFYTGLVTMGYMLAGLIALAVLVAFGFDAIVAWVGDLAYPPSAGLRLGAAIIVAAALLIPSLVVHAPLANEHNPDMLARYADTVFSELPRNAVLMTYNSELMQPFVYAQTVEHKRPDVTVVSGSLFSLAWYREELAQRLHIDPTTLSRPDGASQTQALVKLMAPRPVYVDQTAMRYIWTKIGYELAGLVARVDLEASPGGHVHSAATIADTLHAADAADAVTTTADDRWPIENLYFMHERAHIEAAKADALLHDYAASRQQLREAGGFTGRASISDYLARIGDLIAQQNPAALQILPNM